MWRDKETLLVESSHSKIIYEEERARILNEF